MTISELNIFAFELISSYFGFSKKFVLSSKLNVDAKSSKKLLTITKILNGKRYITGLGALNYIDYKIFEDENISLEYMNYGLNEYSQMYGSFTPYVTVLDLIANEGKAGAKFINSKSIYWKEFINEE
jgi:hypothetical protein